MSDSFILRDRVWREQNERVTLSSIATLSEKTEGRETRANGQEGKQVGR